jgi:hypothetical protein
VLYIIEGERESELTVFIFIYISLDFVVIIGTSHTHCAVFVVVSDWHVVRLK